MFAKGIWVGKSSWTDCHIVLTPEGAVESRSVRRLPEQFNSFDMVLGKGLPWCYSGTGVLTKRVGKRHRIPGEVEHATEEETQQLQQHEETLEEKRRSERGGATTPGLSGLVTPRGGRRRSRGEEKGG